MMMPFNNKELTISWFNNIFKEQFTITDIKFGEALQEGTGYLGQMVRASLYGSDSAGKDKLLHLITKLAPQNPGASKIVKENYCFPKEIEFYTKLYSKIVETGIALNSMYLKNMLPLCYYSDVEELGGVLVMEDLNTEGYDIMKGMDYFSIHHQTEVVKCLADFHAAGFCYISKAPCIEKEFPVISRSLSDSVFIGMIEASELSISALSNVQELGLTLQTFKAAISNKSISEIFSNSIASTEYKFTGVCHSDLWKNNIMFKGNNGTPQVKIIDWQLAIIGCPLLDVATCIFTNTDPSVLYKDAILLIRLYFDKFLANMRVLNMDYECDFETFLNEFKTVSTAAVIFSLLVLFLNTSKHFIDDILLYKNGNLENIKSTLEFHQYLFDKFVTGDLRNKILDLFRAIEHNNLFLKEET